MSTLRRHSRIIAQYYENALMLRDPTFAAEVDLAKVGVTTWPLPPERRTKPIQRDPLPSEIKERRLL